MASGKARKMFPGNNTSEGFYSLYHYLINPADAVRIFILKGGPGVGKSTLMKKLGAEMLEKGYDVEYHYCSSDNDSLDGVVFPAVQVAILDGTAPHIVDPKFPGAVEEIINLGSNWDKRSLGQDKEQIIRLNKLKARMFQAAYSHLKEARVAQEEMEGYYEEAMNRAGLTAMLQATETAIFEKARSQATGYTTLRRLFASANMPGGYVHYLESILEEAVTLYLLVGKPVSNKEAFLETVLHRGSGMGLACEAYHCPFLPNRLELVYFPVLHTGIVRMNPLMQVNLQSLSHLKSCVEISFDEYLDPLIYKTYQAEISEASDRVALLRQKAWDKLKRAKAYHEEIEKMYVKAVDFRSVDQKREDMLAEILAIAESMT